MFRRYKRERDRCRQSEGDRRMARNEKRKYSKRSKLFSYAQLEWVLGWLVSPEIVLQKNKFCIYEKYFHILLCYCCSSVRPSALSQDAFSVVNDICVINVSLHFCLSSINVRLKVDRN